MRNPWAGRGEAGARAISLEREADYRALFAEAQEEQGYPLPDGTVLETPWPRTRRQNFWLSYLEQTPLGAVEGREAYRQLVPLRARLPWPITVSGFNGRAEVEGFCYGHGVACAVTIDCTDALGCEEAALLAPAIRRARLLSVPGPRGLEALSLNDLADRTLSHLTRLIQGEAGKRGRGTALEPFSIATVLRGGGVHPALPLAERGPEHRLLEALTRWQVVPAEVPTPPIGEARIPLGTTDIQAGDLLYGHTRARAVWLPRRFAGTQPSASLGCYHRNLIFAALQVESLGGVIRQGAARLARGDTLSGPLRARAQRAYGALSRLHSGGKDVTYRTMSTQHQIVANGLLAPLNQVRQAFGRAALGEPV